MTVTVAAMLAFASLAVWGFGRVGRSVDRRFRRRYQAIYDAAVAWLDSHGVSVAGLWARAFQRGLDAALGAADHRAGEHDARASG